MSIKKALLFGIAEKIGESSGIITHNFFDKKGNILKKVIKDIIPDHHKGLNKIVELLVDGKYGAIHDKKELDAVGHRVVHGGEIFKSPTLIDERVIAEIKKNIPLAPLHNPPNLTGIELARSIFSDSPHVAVFDTAFHQSIPPKAFLYALPYSLYEKHKIRKYGFHGTSHLFVAQEAAKYLGCLLKDLNLITIHLGNGASMAALEKGKCVDTSMGLTPLEGLVMGSRCGDIDPAILFYLANYLDMSMEEIEKLLNKKSGLKGICGENDMREIVAKSRQGDYKAILAADIYCYRIKKYIGAYTAVLGSCDCIVFTGGIGENSSYIRLLCCQGLSKFGVDIDHEKNNRAKGKTAQISSEKSTVKILAIPTNEELKIANETKCVIEKNIKSTIF